MSRVGDVMIKDPAECLAKYKTFKTLLQSAVEQTDAFLITVQDMEQIGNNMNAAKEALNGVRLPLAESLAAIEAQESNLRRMCANLEDSQNVQTF